MYTTVSSRAYITNCTFERNSAPYFGAAVYVEGSSRIKIISSTFQHNVAIAVRHMHTPQPFPSPTYTPTHTSTHLAGCTTRDG